jgi:hypothetical protein
MKPSESIIQLVPMVRRQIDIRLLLATDPTNAVGAGDRDHGNARDRRKNQTFSAQRHANYRRPGRRG